MTYQHHTAQYCAFSPSSMPSERAQGRPAGHGTGRLNSRLATWLARVLDLIFLWHERARGRRQLGALDGRMLADIGVDTATAKCEADTPFWR
jgi:uncharacterized protein YjiS (DUF1127 family)